MADLTARLERDNSTCQACGGRFDLGEGMLVGRMSSPWHSLYVHREPAKCGNPAQRIALLGFDPEGRPAFRRWLGDIGGCSMCGRSNSVFCGTCENPWLRLAEFPKWELIGWRVLPGGGCEGRGERLRRHLAVHQRAQRISLAEGALRLALRGMDATCLREVAPLAGKEPSEPKGVARARNLAGADFLIAVGRLPGVEAAVAHAWSKEQREGRGPGSDALDLWENAMALASGFTEAEIAERRAKADAR